MDTFGLFFFVRRDKARKTGEVPIYLRITVNRERADLAIKRRIDPSRWDPHRGYVKGTRQDAREINEYIDLIRTKAHKAHQQMVDAGIPFSARMVRALLQNRKKKNRGLVALFDKEVQQMKELIGKGYAQNTYKRYNSCLTHVKNFLQKHYHVQEMDLSEITLAFIKDFEYYLKGERNCYQNTTLKYIAILKKMVLIALRNEWIVKDPFRNYHEKYEHTEREFLNAEELASLESKELPVGRLDRVRDIFVFSCYTGLSYADVDKLNRHHLVTGLDGKSWIHIDRTKTGTLAKIPLLSPARAILDKYKDYPGLNNGKLLPTASNQKMNAYLQEIAAICKIDKWLTYHVARHTFATTMTLARGVSTESVQKMLGHKSIRTTQVYARIVDSKVGDEMSRLEETISHGKEKPEKEMGHPQEGRETSCTFSFGL